MPRLPHKIQFLLSTLFKEMENYGPVRGNWPNYSKLSENKHHCHITKKGKPSYVVCWELIDKKIKIIEVYYVGTREKAPY
ncbi:MAG: cytotoxic translational repressor of toxin-antitoxin stability system [Pseudomonadota bacterium]